MAKLSGNKTIGKQWMPKEEQRNMTRILSQSGGHRMRSTEILSEPTDGRKNIADTWTASRRSTSLTPHPGIRGRYESTSTLACNDEDRQAGPMKARRDFRPTTKILASLRQEVGRQKSFIPKNAKTIRWSTASRVRMDESKLEDLFLATFFFVIFTKLVATRTSILSMAWTPRHSMARSPMERSKMVNSQIFPRSFAYRKQRSPCKRLAV